MARQIASGTPSKSSRHVVPADERRILFVSLGGGAMLIAAVGLVTALGNKSVLSPGDVVAAHAHINAQCSLCHDEGRSMWQDVSGAETGSSGHVPRLRTAGTIVRCERCHDPAIAGRLTNASHVLLGSGDPMKASRAPELACTKCHVDHRGSQASLRRVDDRECATCHRRDFTGVLTIAPLTSFATHPEFAAAKARRTTGVGLLFGHVSHFDYVLRERRGVKDVSTDDALKGSAETCDRCHLTTRDRREFVPVSFDTGCAGSMCHTDDRGPINEGTRDIALSQIVLNAPGAVTPPGEGDDETKAFSGLRHKDEWAQFNAAWLRAGIDPAGLSAERDALRSALSWLDQQATPAPWQAATADDLTRWKTALRGEIGDLDTRMAAANRSGDELKTLAADFDAVKALLLQTGAPAGPDVGPSVAAATDDDPAQLLALRRQELLNLLAAVRARADRAGDRALADRVGALEARVNRLTAGGASSAPNLPSLRAELSIVDEVARTVRDTNDAQAQQDLAALQVLRAFAAGSGLGGLAPGEFDLRRQEINRLLDVVAQLGNPALQPRVADLRSRLAVVASASGNSDDLNRRRLERARVLDRVQLELELVGSSDRAAPIPPVIRDDAARRMTDDLRQTLARLDRASRAPAAPESERGGRQQTLSALLAPCLKCHLYDGEDETRVNAAHAPDASAVPTRSMVDVMSRTGLRLSRVTAAEPMMKRARFAHGPHLVATTCTSCHATLGRSTLAIDFNSPGVSTCQSCHRSAGARTACSGCHVYHPASSGKLLQTLWSAN